MDELKSDDWFDELRKKAKVLLEILGEPYAKPKLDGTTYIQGA